MTSPVPNSVLITLPLGMCPEKMEGCLKVLPEHLLQLASFICLSFFFYLCGNMGAKQMTNKWEMGTQTD